MQSSINSSAGGIAYALSDTCCLRFDAEDMIPSEAEAVKIFSVIFRKVWVCGQGPT